MKIHVKIFKAFIIMCFALSLGLQAQTFNGPLTDSLCVDAYGNFTTIAPSLIMPSNFPIDSNGNYIFCADGTFDGFFPLQPGNGNLPNNDYIIEYSNGASISISENGTWNSDTANLELGDTVFITALTYDLDSVNNDLIFAGTLCPLLDVLYPDILPCTPINDLLSGNNDGVPGLNSLEEVISFAGSLSGDVASVDSIISAFYGINDAIAGFGAAICFGLSETVAVISVEDCSNLAIAGCTDEIACNYLAEALQDDGSCVFVGDSCNDNSIYTFDDIYITDCNCEGTLIVLGCTDTNACNFDMAANTDDGNCLMEGDSCDDNDVNTTNDIYLTGCLCEGEPIVLGCIDSTACNFDIAANTDDASCLLIGDICDDNDAYTEGDIYSDNCECIGVVGIETFDYKNRISIDNLYPLPVQENLNLSISTTENGKLKVIIFNVDGKLIDANYFVAGSDLSNITINTRDLANGIYFMELSISDYSITKKIIK